LTQQVKSLGSYVQFGGRRPWFFCPKCISRVAILYFCREDWACRRCCDLRYQSELEAKGRRGLMRARKIQARLGGDRSGFEFPEPKGMHWRTYERWREKHEAAVAKSWSGFWGSRGGSASHDIACSVVIH
jgi:hypothetical protein